MDVRGQFVIQVADEDAVLNLAMVLVIEIIEMIAANL